MYFGLNYRFPLGAIRLTGVLALHSKVIRVHTWFDVH
jgi:hypothetical protein